MKARVIQRCCCQVAVNPTGQKASDVLMTATKKVPPTPCLIGRQVGNPDLLKAFMCWAGLHALGMDSPAWILYLYSCFCSRFGYGLRLVLSIPTIFSFRRASIHPFVSLQRSRGTIDGGNTWAPLALSIA